MRAGPILALLLGLATAACAADGSSAPPGIFFPTVPIAEAYPAALMDGVLEVEDGCVYVANGGERWLALWPEGYTATLSQGRLEVRDGDGTRVAREGGRVTLGGGEVNPVEVGWVGGLGPIRDRAGRPGGSRSVRRPVLARVARVIEARPAVPEGVP